MRTGCECDGELMRAEGLSEEENKKKPLPFMRKSIYACYLVAE